MQRKLRVCCELPPRHSRGAASSSITLAPASRAIRAAHSAALPPPTTKTSTMPSSPNQGTDCTQRVTVAISGRRQLVFTIREGPPPPTFRRVPACATRPPAPGAQPNRQVTARRRTGWPAE
ncbi:hypothetical protein G6F57_018222 [Rhizopus arrhizus]|nr:hypothetical protein G6F57_018222 [Rhizopus arrhizus]